MDTNLDAEEEVEIVVPQRAPCVVCNGTDSLKRSFGMPCCNSCDVFLRRNIRLYKNYQDIDQKKTISKLDAGKFERLQSILSSGLLTAHYKMDVTSEKFLDRVVKHLGIIEWYRTNKFEWCNVSCITPAEAIENFRNPIQYTHKPVGAQMSCVQWSLLNQITSLDYLKKFEIVRKGFLTTEDSEKFLKGAYIKNMLFSTAWRNFQQNEGELKFPGEVDVFSDEVNANQSIGEDLKKDIRTKIIRAMKGIELKQEEYLLLAAIFAMDPAGIPLSPSGQQLLTIHRDYYASALLKYCQTEYNGNIWPSRLGELYGLHRVIGSTYEKFCALVTLYSTFQPVSDEKRKFESLIKFAEED